MTPKPNRRPTRLLPLTLALALTSGLVLLPASPSAWAQAAPAAASAPAATLRAEVAKPLQAAQAALQASNHKDALARVAEAEAIPALTPYEVYITRRLKAPALFGSGDVAAALGLFETIVGMPELPAADKLPMRETTIKLAMQLKDYPRSVPLFKAYFAEGGANAELKRLYPQVLAVTGDHAGVVREVGPLVSADDTAGRKTAEDSLRLLAASQNALGDKDGYLQSLGRLAASTGKADYWSELVARTIRRDGFAEDRLRLETYRLRRAAGLPLEGGELADMAARASQAGLPGEAQVIMDDGYAQKLLGVGADAAADAKLREQVTKAAGADRATFADSESSAQKAKDGNALVGLGMALSGSGQFERGLALVSAGVERGGLRRPDEAQLHLGVAQYRAGKKAEALKSFAQVKGADGLADVARLWTLLLQSPVAK